MRSAPVFLPANHQTGVSEERAYLVERREPDRVGVWHARPFGLGQGHALLHREPEPSAEWQRTRDCLHQRLLVSESEQRLEQEHRIERPGGEWWDLRDHESARQ